MRRLTVAAAIAAAALLILASLAAARSGRAENLGFSRGVTPAFRAAAIGCISKFERLGGFALRVYRAVYDSPEVIALQPPANGGHQSFAASAIFLPTHTPVIKIEWAQESGTYALDGAPEVPCAILLHEMRHAWDFATGKVGKTSTTDQLTPAALHDPALLRQALYAEGLGVQAENYYLWRHKLRQRRHYALFRLTSCVPHPETQGPVYLQGCFGTFILPSWVVWR